MERAYIAVVQKHESVLEDIKQSVEEKGTPNEVAYSTSPVYVIKRADLRPPQPIDVVISGNIFDHGRSGTEFAKDLKMLVPDVLFLMYSIMPEVNEQIDGIIEKPDWALIDSELHGNLVEILTSQEFGEIAKRKPIDYNRLREQFPQIQLLNH